MNRGIVVEASSKHLIVMTADAQFVRIKPDGKTAPGAEIYYFPEDKIDEKKQLAPGKIVLAACVFLLALVLTVSFVPIDQPVYAIVSVDINPSALLYLDDAQTVLRYRFLNDQARELLHPAMIGLPIEEALGQMIESASVWLEENPKPILIGYSAPDQDVYTGLSRRIASFALEEDAHRFALVGTQRSWTDEASIGKRLMEESPSEEGDTGAPVDLKRIDRGSIQEGASFKGPPETPPGHEKQDEREDREESPGKEKEQGPPVDGPGRGIGADPEQSTFPPGKERDPGKKDKEPEVDPMEKEKMIPEPSQKEKVSPGAIKRNHPRQNPPSANGDPSERGRGQGEKKK